jgi:hypothetical protein
MSSTTGGADGSEDCINEEEVGKEPSERPGGPPEKRKTRAEGDESLAEHLLQVQARDGLIPVDEAFVVANEDDLVLIN